jgi:hypothetical protein
MRVARRHFRGAVLRIPPTLEDHIFVSSAFHTPVVLNRAWGVTAISVNRFKYLSIAQSWRVGYFSRSPGL